MQKSPPDWLIYVDNYVRWVLARIGVPLFFLMSGFLFFRSGFTIETYKKKLKRRTKTLLVPYIIWNAFFILWTAIKTLPSLHPYFPSVEHGNWTLRTVIACFVDNGFGVFSHVDRPFDIIGIFCHAPIDTPLWYVRNLMVAVVFSPIVYWIIRETGWCAILGLGIIWGVLFPRENYLLMTIFFFSWGACYAIKGIDFVVSMRRFRIAPYLYIVVAITDMLTKGQAYNCQLHNVGIVLGMFTAVSLTASLLESGEIRVNKFLANASFFVFALHCAFLGFLPKLVIMVFSCDSDACMAFLYFFVPTLVIAICLSIYMILHRYIPRVADVLTGGR